jgi:hypothetical protein
MAGGTLGRLASLALAAILLSASAAARSPGTEAARAKPGTSATGVDAADSTARHGKGKAHPPRHVGGTSRGPSSARHTPARRLASAAASARDTSSTMSCR